MGYTFGSQVVTSLRDGLTNYHIGDYRCQNEQTVSVQYSSLPIQNSASAIYFSPWSDPTNLSYMIFDSNLDDENLNLEFSRSGEVIFVDYSVCEERNSGVDYCTYEFLDYSYTDYNYGETKLTMLLSIDSDGDMVTDFSDDLPFQTPHKILTKMVMVMVMTKME